MNAFSRKGLVVTLLSTALATTLSCASTFPITKLDSAFLHSPTAVHVFRVGDESKFLLSTQSLSYERSGVIFSAYPNFEISTYVDDPLAERTEAISRMIDESVAGARADQWDGPGTFAVSEDTESRALILAARLPAFLPLPDVSITPSGSVAFSWDSGTKAQLTILAPAQGGISFAAYFEGDRIHGALRLDSDQLPQEVMAAAERWNRYSDDTAGDA